MRRRLLHAGAQDPEGARQVAEQGHQAGTLLGLLQWAGAGEEKRPLEGDRLGPVRLLSSLRLGRRICPVLQSRQVHRQQCGHPQVSMAVNHI